MRSAILATAFLVSSVRAAGPSTFAVVIHQSNPFADLRLGQLRAYFGGASKRWPNGTNVVLVERDSGSAAFRCLLERVLNLTASEYKRRLMRIEYSGDTRVNVKTLNSDGAACKFVFNVPAAIAVVETSSLSMPECSVLQIVKVDGKLPGEEGYRLR